MSARIRTVLTHVGSFVLAGLLLYLALRGVDFGAVVGALQRADYRWLALLVVVALASHLLRAWRWRALIDALPEPEAQEQPGRVSLGLAFRSVMIGYMVNYAAPRLGEVARTANLAAQSRRRFSAVFGTVVAERVLDVLVLGLVLASVFFLLLDRTATLGDLFVDPLVDRLGRGGVLLLAGLLVTVSGLVLALLRRALRREQSALRVFWGRRVAPVLASFKDGLLTLGRTRRPAGIVLSTVAMWGCYGLMAHLPFLMLGMTGSYELSLLDSWAIMALGAIGVVIPSPGGVGSYHYITIQTLVHLFAVEQDAAATYAVLTHAAQLVLYVLIGAACLMQQGSRLSALRRDAGVQPPDPELPPP